MLPVSRRIFFNIEHDDATTKYTAAVVPEP